VKEGVNWTVIKNEYINGNISHRKLSEKHGVAYATLRARAEKEKWSEQKKKQQRKISENLAQKTAEKIAEKESDRLLRISNAADALLKKIEEATKQLDVILIKDKRKYTQKVADPETKEPVDVFMEEEIPRLQSIGQIDKAGLRQLVTSLKDIRDIQLANSENSAGESPNIHITVVAASDEDFEQDIHEE